MSEYYLSYDPQNFSEELLEAIREVGLYPTKEKAIECINNICFIYDIPKPRLNLCNVSNFEGMYIGVRREIVLNERIELIKLLHELRHHIQRETMSYFELSYEDKELEARMWSASLFYKVFPKEFIELCILGKIRYI